MSSCSRLRERLDVLSSRLAEQPDLGSSPATLPVADRVERVLRDRMADERSAQRLEQELHRILTAVRAERMQRATLARKADAGLSNLATCLRSAQRAVAEECVAAEAEALETLQQRTDAAIAEHHELLADAPPPPEHGARGLLRVRQALADEKRARARLEEAFAARLATEGAELRARLAEERAAREDDEQGQRRQLQAALGQLQRALAAARADREAADAATLQLVRRLAQASPRSPAQTPAGARRERRRTPRAATATRSTAARGARAARALPTSPL